MAHGSLAVCDAWELITAEAEEFIDAGDDIVVPLDLIASGGHSSIEVEMTVCDVLTMRDGKVVRHRVYANREEALKAVGLHE